jgi:hypothetical protein
MKLAGKTEAFTISVTYDTLELYGVVQGTRTFTIGSE